MNSVPYPAHEQYLDWLADRLTVLRREQPGSAQDRLFSISLALPGFRLLAAPRLREGDFYWSAPEQGSHMLGRGRAWQSRSRGEDRLQYLDRQLRDLQPHWRHLDPDGLKREPLALTAAAFDGEDPMQGDWQGFPNAVLFVPQLLLEQDSNGCRLVLSAPSGNDAACVADWLEQLDGLLQDSQSTDPPLSGAACQVDTPRHDDPAWLSLARRALDSIERGPLEKLVLYRQSSRPLSASGTRALLHALEAAYPDCRLIALQQEAAEFICASPEQLLVKRGSRVYSDALAGTAPRGADAASSNRLAKDFKHDAKTRREHGLVQNAVRAALQPFCSNLTETPAPEVRPLGRLMHLHNRVSGRLREDSSALQLAARLHPTPAVCGSPKATALHWLRSQDQSRRGWYSGFAGWIARDGDAELNVLLRCALLRNGRAELFAGAGLVPGSNPRDELAETELKLAAVRDHLAPGS